MKRSDVRNYRPGHVLEFHRAVKGIARHEALEVIGVENSKVVARNARGEEREFTAKRVKCFEVYDRHSIDVAPNDRLLLMASGREPRFRDISGELVTVSRIDEHGRVHTGDNATNVGLRPPFRRLSTHLFTQHLPDASSKDFSGEVSGNLFDEAYFSRPLVVRQLVAYKVAEFSLRGRVPWLAELVRPNRSHYMPRPWAVVLSGSTEEVAAVTRVCNKYKIKVKPISTGWYHWAAPMKDDARTVQLDLRRMDKIIEIDEKNMFAIVEPYAICAQLQAEAMKRGLNINIIGAGCSTSIVASACAYFCGGPSSYYMGHNSDNLLGQEWVTPAGEIIRTGSLSSGCGWFCSEGPGPSPRGVTRGVLGSRGGLGTYTKCAIKLSPWEYLWRTFTYAASYQLCAVSSSWLIVLTGKV